MTPIEELIKLEADLESQRKATQELRKRISVLKNTHEVPFLTEKYKNKYFRYTESDYGDNIWDCYCCVIDIKSIYYAIVESFESKPLDAGNEYIFRIGSTLQIDKIEEEITKKEYYARLNDFKAKLSEI